MTSLCYALPIPIGWQFQDGVIGRSLAHATHDGENPYAFMNLVPDTDLKLKKKIKTKIGSPLPCLLTRSCERKRSSLSKENETPQHEEKQRRNRGPCPRGASRGMPPTRGRLSRSRRWPHTGECGEHLRSTHPCGEARGEKREARAPRLPDFLIRIRVSQPRRPRSSRPGDS